MEVLHIANDYRDGNLYETLFKKIYDNGIKQTVFVPSQKEIKSKNKKEFKIVNSNSYSDFDRFFFMNKGRKIYSCLNKNLMIEKFDLIHAHTLFSNGIIAYQIKEQFNKEYIVSVRGTDINIFFKKLIHLRKKGIEILRGAKRIIFITPAIKKNLCTMIKNKEIIDMINEKSIIISNGIDDFWFNASQNKNSNLEYIDILQVGWYSKNKNQINTFKAFEILNNWGYKSTLKFIGGTTSKMTDRHYKKKLLKHISLSENRALISVENPQNKEKLIEAYSHANIYVMPSYQETFGLSYIEALSQNVPVIYSLNQSIDGFFEKPVGVAIEPGSPESIASGIVEVHFNSVYKENIQNNLGQFKWDNISKEISELYLS